MTQRILIATDGSELSQRAIAAGIALLTWIIRTFGAYPDGIAFAVLLMNLCAPLIDLLSRALHIEEADSPAQVRAKLEADDSTEAREALKQFHAQKAGDLLRATGYDTATVTRVQELIAEGRVLVNGAASKASHRVQAGDAVEAEAAPRPPLRAQAQGVLPMPEGYSPQRQVLMDAIDRIRLQNQPVAASIALGACEAQPVTPTPLPERPALPAWDALDRRWGAYLPEREWGKPDEKQGHGRRFRDNRNTDNPRRSAQANAARVGDWWCVP